MKIPHSRMTKICKKTIGYLSVGGIELLCQEWAEWPVIFVRHLQWSSTEYLILRDGSVTVCWRLVTTEDEL